DATHGRSVARERRDRPGVVQARPVSVARIRTDVSVRPRVLACGSAVTGPGAHVPLGVLAGLNSVATVLGDGAVVRETGTRPHAAVLPNAALVELARGVALAGELRDLAGIP